MINKLIDDMNNALKANCYLAALSIALMLPDICGKAAYPQKLVGERYIKWFDENIGAYEQDSDTDKICLPHLNGALVYNLRNYFLHQGTPTIDKVKQDIDCFQLIIEKQNEFDMYADESGCMEDNKRGYQVNIRRLCLVIGQTAKWYYEQNKEKFNFFHYSIIDKRA